MEREKEVAESYQMEITLLQQGFAEYVEEGNAKPDCSASLETTMARDLKLQLEEKELQLEKMHHEVKSAIKARDDAICANDELIVSQQAEHKVSRPSYPIFTGVPLLQQLA